ncbi:MAG: serine/threonine protein kinase [Gammaproteobacteria bacterium]|nr:MAG: serine/threonine protein kinase [Gammaproteobacteria bacterium]
MNIPGYRVEKEIGRGGMANVWLARRESDGLAVAVKVMHANLASDPSLVERFIAEGETHAQFEHPQIIRIHEVLRLGDGRPALVMDYLEGETFKDLLKREQRLSPEALFNLLKPVLAALDHIHRKGFVHRDIKPENIFLCRSRGPVLMDFGIARQVDRNTRFTEAGMAIGTPHYMSPEQARGEKTDHLTDIYAVGVMIYEALTGRVPFDAADSFAIAIKHIQDVAAPLPAELERLQPLIDKALAKVGSDRYQTVADLLADFEKGLAGKLEPTRPVSAAPPRGTEVIRGAGTEVTAAPKKRAPVLALVVGVVLAVAAIGGYLALQSKPSPRIAGGGGGGAPPVAKGTAPQPVAPAPVPVKPGAPTVAAPSKGADVAAVLAGNHALKEARAELQALLRAVDRDGPGSFKSLLALRERVRAEKDLADLDGELVPAINKTGRRVALDLVRQRKLSSPAGACARDIIEAWLKTGLRDGGQEEAVAGGVKAYLALARAALKQGDEGKVSGWLEKARDFAGLLGDRGGKLLAGTDYAAMGDELKQLRQRRIARQQQQEARRQQQRALLDQVWALLQQNQPWQAEAQLAEIDTGILPETEVKSARTAVVAAIGMRRSQADSLLERARESVTKSRFGRALDFCDEAQRAYPRDGLDLSVCDEARRRKAELLGSWAQQNNVDDITVIKTK